jgi:hypothetical protein
MITKEWETFFYYGEGNLLEEINVSVLEGVLQSRGRLSFNRKEGTTIFQSLGRSLTLQRELEIRFDIAEWAGRYNFNVPNGDG